MFKLDENQIELKKEFDDLLPILNRKPSFFEKIFGKKNESKFAGFYIYSKPGRGKTMLMKKFFEEVQIPKAYFHFNEFMFQIHQNKHKTRRNKSKAQYSNQDLLVALKKVVKKSKLICFDEFQVDDIADAMILGRIFTYFVENDIFVIATSNTEPQNLYKNGIQREIFMKFVEEQILEKFKIIHFKSDKDYRLIHDSNIDERYFLKKGGTRNFNVLISQITNKKRPKVKNLEIWGRQVKVEKAIDNIAIFDYDELFLDNLSAADYKVICQEFDLIFLKNLPKFNSESKNEIKRFMLFIDEVYENKVALIILAQVKIESIYQNKKDVKTNARVTSRLNEIKSDFYFNNSKYIKNAS